MSNRNPFITGITEYLFLSLLQRHECYVYDITKTIRTYSGGLLAISPNTIYTTVYKLEHDGLIKEYTKLVGRKRTRVYYHIEPKGQEYLKNISEQYRQVTQGVDVFFKAIEESDPYSETEPG